MAETQTNGTAIQPSEGAKLTTLRSLIESQRERFAEVATAHLKPERLVRVAVAALSKTPNLMLCSTNSLLQSIMQAAQIGLEPGGALGEAYLVPYKNKGGGYTCQLIVGYRGMITLARRSGQIVSVEAHVVYANDKFTCRLGLNPVLDHEPTLIGEPGSMLFVYAVAKFKDGGYQFEVMTRPQVDRIRGLSPAADEGPWKTHYDEMARKTVVRRLCKYLPLTAESREALEVVEANEPYIEVDTTPVETPKSKTESVKEKVRAKLAAPEPEPTEEPPPFTYDEASSKDVSPATPPPPTNPPSPAAGRVVSSEEEKAAAKDLAGAAAAEIPKPKKMSVAEEACALTLRFVDAKKLSELVNLNREIDGFPEPYRSELTKASDERKAEIVAGKKDGK